VLLRDLRWVFKLSQRELAERAGLPQPTIARIESRATANPGVRTIATILGSCGVELIPMCRGGDELGMRPDFDGGIGARDRVERQLPAHLSVERLHEWDGWWGWFRIAWSKNDSVAPRYWYWRRPRFPREY